MSARWITALFLAFGTLWIWVSDRVIESLSSDVTVLSQLQSRKGMAFVTLSAGLIYLLTRRAELRRAALERKTREQRDHLAHVLNVSPAVIYALNRPTGGKHPWALDLVGDNILGVTGYSPEVWRSDAGLWLRSIHPDDRPRVLEAQAMVEHLGTVQHEYRFLCADQSYRWINDKLVFQKGKEATRTA